MRLKTVILGKTYEFKDVKDVLAKANEEKSGDILAGVAAESDSERIAAKEVLSNLLVSDLRENPVVPYEEDDVTRLNQDSLNEKIYGEIKGWTMAQLREYILDLHTTEADIRRLSRGLTSETIAGVCKLMSNLDLIYGANKVRVTAHCNTTIGKRGCLSTRLQPNHTTDNPDGITASLFEGLSYGCGDALLGLNPVNDTIASLSEVLKRFDEVKNEFEIPTQICVLGHITTQIEAVKRGAPCDMIFQSIAGSQKGNEAFGFTTDIVREARHLMLTEGTATGPNVMYFETGQGSELSSDAHFGADHHFMGKLSGIPMGCDCCYTNHMMADQNDIENLSLLLASCGINYILGVPSSDDVMLNYQTNAYHDTAALREILNLRPIKEFEQWLEKMGFYENGKLTDKAGDPTVFLKH